MAYYHELHTLDGETALYFYGIHPRWWGYKSHRQLHIDLNGQVEERIRVPGGRFLPPNPLNGGKL